MGYNGGKRVWPQRNSGFSKSSVRFGNKIFRMVTMPVLKIGFSALGLSNSGRKTYRRSSFGKAFIGNQSYRNIPAVNVPVHIQANCEPFFSTLNLMRFSNSRFELEIVKFNEIADKNKVSKLMIGKLRSENITKQKRLKSKQWLRLFLKKEIVELENEILRNEVSIKDLNESLINEYLDFTAFKYSDKFDEFCNLTNTFDFDISTWMIYPLPSFTFQLYREYLNYSILFQRNKIQLQQMSIPFIDNVTEKYICIKDSSISMLFLPYAIIIFTKESNFAVLKYNDCKPSYKEVLIKEDETFKNVDAVIDSFICKYQKLDGTPDKRYKYNPQVPVVNYSNISIQSIDGLRIEFLFLYQEFGRRFFETFSNLTIDP